MNKSIEERLKDPNITKDDFRRILEDMGDDYVGVLNSLYTRKDGKIFIKKDPKFKICKKCEKKKESYEYKILNEYSGVAPNFKPPSISNLISEMECSNGHKWEYEHQNTDDLIEFN